MLVLFLISVVVMEAILRHAGRKQGKSARGAEAEQPATVSADASGLRALARAVQNETQIPPAAFQDSAQRDRGVAFQADAARIDQSNREYNRGDVRSK
jgi:hypothetical protein